jgi:hypothetical protein
MAFSASIVALEDSFITGELSQYGLKTYPGPENMHVDT